MIEILDAVREFIGELGATVDDSLSEPLTYEDGVIYVWAETVTDVSIETGDGVRRDFEIMIVIPVGNTGEAALAKRDRDVSLKLDAMRTSVMNAVNAHRNAGPWSYLAGARSEEDFLRQIALRGVAIRVGGYILPAS